jgi:hypothetical protein
MRLYNSNRSMPGIFENPLSKVKIGRLYWRAVAAMNASDRDTFIFCLNEITISFVSSLYGIMMHSASRPLQVSNWGGVILGIPRNSISVTKETISRLSEYAANLGLPSSRSIRILVFAKKSIYRPEFFLMLQAVQSTLQSTKVFLGRWFPFILLQFG